MIRIILFQIRGGGGGGGCLSEYGHLDIRINTISLLFITGKWIHKY